MNLSIVKKYKQLKTLILIMGLITLIGCGSSLPTVPLDKTAPEAVIGPGDQIEIKFAYAEQYNEIQAVRPDGKVQLLLVGEVTAQGKTPSELGQELLKLYSVHLKHPELAVMVRFSPVYVGGAVMAPGQLVELTGRLTVLEAIMHAGGFNIEIAETEDVVIIRHKDGKRHSYLLNLKDALEKEQSQSFYLEPRDIVWVPRTTIVNVDVWVDQHIRRLIPIGIGGGFSFGGP
jgi:protein involved in polysaccharide export with SLBB domain